MSVTNPRRALLEIVHADVVGLEHDLPTSGEPCSNQILHHLVLAVDHHMLANQVGEIDPMIRAIEPHDHTRMQHAFLPHARAHSRVVQQLLRSVLQHTRANAVFDVVARTRLEHDRFDALQMQQMRQQQPSRAGSNNTNLRPHPMPPCARV
jgi:hypothetical protein